VCEGAARARRGSRGVADLAVSRLGATGSQAVVERVEVAVGLLLAEVLVAPAPDLAQVGIRAFADDELARLAAMKSRVALRSML
jgi:hypothetical protein